MQRIAVAFALLVTALPSYAADPNAPDGIEGFKTSIALRKEKFPSAKNEKHWDVAQPIPEKPANNNGMF
jgi:hypothetical protein